MIDNRSHRGAGASPQTKSRTGTEQSQSVILQSSLIEASTLLFWSAFILTRPLGATVGDLLDKPLDQGGLAFSRFSASAILAAVIVACLLFLPQKAGRHPGARESKP
jgi:uncharacterized membrane-anchored protein